MPVNQAFPSLNGIEPSWADIAVNLSIKIGPAPGPVIPMSGIAAIKWSRKVDVGESRGASGGRIRAQTTGQLTNEASMELYKDTKQLLLVGLATAAAAQGLMRGNQAIISLVKFDIDIQYTPPNSVLIFETVLKGCRYLGDDDDAKEGTDPAKITVSMKPIEIVDVLTGGLEAVLL